MYLILVAIAMLEYDIIEGRLLRSRNVEIHVLKIRFEMIRYD
jgi:hypothetical protein